MLYQDDLHKMKVRPQGCDFLGPEQCPLCLGDGGCHWPPEPEEPTGTSTHSEKEEGTYSVQAPGAC